MSESEVEALKTEVAELRHQMQEQSLAIGALQKAGFVTLLDLKRVVPAILNWASAERGPSSR